MHFPILVCHASIHCWKDSPGMALLMASTPLKQILLSLWKRKKSNEKDQVNSSLGTIFVLTFHMPKSSVVIFQTLYFFMSNWLAIIQSTNDCYTSTVLPTWYWPQSYFLKTSLSWVYFYLFVSLFETLVLFKDMCVWHGVLYTYWKISSACDREFPPPPLIRLKISGLFIDFSLFIPQCL